MDIKVFEFDFIIPVVTSKPAEKLATRRLKESFKYRTLNPNEKRKKYLSPIYVDSLGNHVTQETPGRILYTNNLIYLKRMDQSLLLRELMKINEINKSKNEQGRNLQEDGNRSESVESPSRQTNSSENKEKDD